MPNQVTAGLIAVCPAYLRFEPSTSDAITVAGAACVGGAISFARELTRTFELRVRVEYDKPFFFDDAVGTSLHDFRATAGPSFVAYRMKDNLTITVGAEIGLAGFIVDPPDAQASPTPLPQTEAWGLVVGGSAAIRPWLTYHTGLFAEVGYGYAVGWSNDLDVRATTIGRLMVGWADRF